MNAGTLVNFLLELNVLNANDIDIEVKQLAARLKDPRAKAWFSRVVRFFLINIDQLAREPYVAQAEPRTNNASKYYYHPQGGWVAGRAPRLDPHDPTPIKEGYDPTEKTYTTMLHKPAVERDIDQNYAPFKPAKAKARGLFGGPPTKKQLQPWMTAPGSETKEFHHFDPIGTRRRELFQRLESLVNYLNHLSRMASRAGSEDPAEAANAAEAEKTLHSLVQMKTGDVHSFRRMMRNAEDFGTNVRERPELYVNDGKVIARHENLTLRKAMTVEVATALMLRPCSPASQGSFSKSVRGGYTPSWCVNEPKYCLGYLNRGGALYVVFEDEKPIVLGHIPGGEGDIRDTRDASISDEIARKIAPLFVDESRFNINDLSHGSAALGRAVTALRRGLRGRG